VGFLWYGVQVKIAYKRKALENHPDRFPPHVKLEAEARFKHVLPSPDLSLV
jgi:curved DNA-binding protein CbpA